MASSESQSAPRGQGKGFPVELNVYDLQHPDNPHAVSTINGYLYNFGVGLFHSGVCIYGVEYAFGGHPDPATGVFSTSPRQAPDASFRQTLLIGFTHLSPEQVRHLIDAMSSVWLGNTYNLLTRNCNHFASDLCERLTGKPAPEWVNRLAWFGEKAKFLLPKAFDTPMAAPVTAQRAAQNHRNCLIDSPLTEDRTFHPNPIPDPDHDQ